VVDLIQTIGLGVITAFLLVLWDWARTSRVIVNAPVEPAVMEDNLQEASPMAEKA
jgi:hypothetical protein